MNRSRPSRLIVIAIGIALVAALTTLRIADPYPVAAARAIALDAYQRLAPRPKTDLPVAMVDIDEASLAALGQWPWPRDRLAELARRLAQLGAASIAFDILFAEPDRLSPARLADTIGAALPPGTRLADYDAEFAAALHATPSVLGFAALPEGGRLPTAPKAGIAVSGNDPKPFIARMGGATLPIPPLESAASGLGGVSLEATDSAGTVRRLPLLWTDGRSLYPALSLEALRLALGGPDIVVLTATSGPGHVEEIRLGDVAIPTTADGALTLYYRHPAADEAIPAKDVLGPDYRALADRVAGRIVLVGTSAAGLYDLRGTPLGDNMPGLMIHAQALEDILSQSFLLRADWVEGLELAVFLVIGLGLVAAIGLAGPLAGLAFGLTALALVIGGGWLAFLRAHWLIDPSFPTAGAVVTFAVMSFARFALTDAERRRIRRAFGHYVAPALLAEIERNRDALRLGGEVRELTILFADLKAFTPLGEALVPEALVGLLNTMFAALGAEITGHLGTIDKFIGDSVMAFWNAPLPAPDHAARALRAALAMQQRMAELNAQGAFAPAGAPVEIGIGIATGPAIVGNMGLASRFDYSAIGDSVNVASRLQDATRRLGCDLLVSAETRAAAPGFAYLPAGALVLKGKAAPEPAYLVLGDEMLAASPAFRALETAYAGLVGELRAGRPAEAALAECRTAADDLGVRLGSYLDRLCARAEDLTPLPPPSRASG